MTPSQSVIPFKAEAYPIRVLRARTFDQSAPEYFSLEEIIGLTNFIAAKPCFGMNIPGAPGLRSFLWKASRCGKRSEAQIVYFFRDLNMPLLFITALPKETVIEFSEDELKQVGRRLLTIIGSLSNDVAFELSA